MTRRERAFLVLRAQSGDLDALDQLLRGVQDRLYRCARAIVGQHETAEDVMQEVFVILCRKMAWLREPDHFDAWALRITSREAIHRVRKERRTSWISDPAIIAELAQEDRSDPIRLVLGERAAELVGRAPAASRSVLALHYLEGLALPEVASVLGIPVGTAKSRLAYGLRFLRRELGPEHE